MFWKWRFFRQLGRAALRWQEDDGNLMAGAVAYFAALSFFPLLLVLIAGVGLLLQTTAMGHDAERQVFRAIGQYTSPEARANVELMLDGIERSAPVGGPVGLVFLLSAAAAIFAQFERAFDRIWNTENPNTRGIIGAIRNIVMYRLRAFLMLMGLLVVILLLFIAHLLLLGVRGAIGEAFPLSDRVWTSAQLAVGLTVSTFVFTALFRVLPKVPVRWQEAARGGLVTAVLWEAGRLLLTLALTRSPFGAYGVVGAFLAVMLWIYFGAAVVFLGAEYVQVLCRECDEDGKLLREKSSPPKPST